MSDPTGPNAAGWSADPAIPDTVAAEALDELVEPELHELALAACWCDELDPRVIEGGGKCGSCDARDELRR